MIYLFYGTDFEKVKEKTKSFEATHRFNGENFNQLELEELIGAQGLFESKYIVALNRIFENVEAKDFVLKHLKELKDSSHIFLLMEGKLDKATLTRIEKQAEKVQEFSAEKMAKKDQFNIFSLTFALEQRDKRKLWILYQTARKNAVPEEIHGILWWKIKTMILSGRVERYRVEELKKIAARLVSMYHDAHRGLFDFDLALEKFILEI